VKSEQNVTGGLIIWQNTVERHNKQRNKISEIKFFQLEDEVISGVPIWNPFQSKAQELTADLSTILRSFRSLEEVDRC
jgi:hypothetical protein